MAQYIDKAALVAEIEELIDKGKYYEEYDCAYRDGNNSALDTLKGKIEALEVKDVDLKNSMVCEVDWYDGFFLDYTQEQQDEVLEKIGANVGDKIRVILIKE